MFFIFGYGVSLFIVADHRLGLLLEGSSKWSLLFTFGWRQKKKGGERNNFHYYFKL